MVDKQMPESDARISAATAAPTESGKKLANELSTMPAQERLAILNPTLTAANDKLAGSLPDFELITKTKSTIVKSEDVCSASSSSTKVIPEPLAILGDPRYTSKIDIYIVGVDSPGTACFESSTGNPERQRAAMPDTGGYQGNDALGPGERKLTNSELARRGKPVSDTSSLGGNIALGPDEELRTNPELARRGYKTQDHEVQASGAGYGYQTDAGSGFGYLHNDSIGAQEQKLTASELGRRGRPVTATETGAGNLDIGPHERNRNDAELARRGYRTSS